MKNPNPDFPPLTLRQLELLEAIKADKEKLATLPPWDPETGTWVPESYETQERIDELSVKALRSGLLRGLPAESRRPDFLLVFDSRGECEEISPGFADFHPELPIWARDHLVEWIQRQRRRKEGRKNLRKTNIVGIETGMRPPINLSLMIRTLELRGAKMEEDPIGSAIANDPPLDTLTEMLNESQRMWADKMSDDAGEREATEKKLTRVRKEWGSWKSVIRQLVKEGLLPKIITPQAFRKRLNRLYPAIPWNKV